MYDELEYNIIFRDWDMMFDLPGGIAESLALQMCLNINMSIAFLCPNAFASSGPLANFDDLRLRPASPFFHDKYSPVNISRTVHPQTCGRSRPSPCMVA